MFCVIYRSTKQDQAYLYIEKKDDFSRVPPDLMARFGKPVLAMLFPLNGSKKLVAADINNVKQSLKDQGFYLQLPPPIENLMKLHQNANQK
ncbi:YcgL domain-containing protein [Sodalis sp. RH21]|uniref:YcgL domain-containing protein n=1 Tax=unclassified Sodalis (in: enterobacteria) TaxID=2636512 RepID=UPI0039B66AE6